jgi:hypothetical protein
MSPLGEENDMMKRSPIFFLVAVVSPVLIWLAAGFAPHGDLHFRKADASTSTALPSNALASETFKAAHTANPMTNRILALDQAKQLALWTSVLKNKKQVCGGVVRTVYQGGTEFGIENWSISCRDGNQYSISLGPDWRGFEGEFRLQFAMETLSPEELISACPTSISARDIAFTCQGYPRRDSLVASLRE